MEDTSDTKSRAQCQRSAAGDAASAAASATVAPQAAVAAGRTDSSFDVGAATDHWTSLFSIVHTALRKRRLQSYASECTRDLLLVLHGFRPAFIVDVFAPLDFWRDLLRQLSTKDDAFRAIGVLDLCAEGCILFDRAALGAKLASDAATLATDDGGVELVNMHAQAKEPYVLTGPNRRRYRDLLMSVISSLLAQSSSHADSSHPLSLELPSLESSTPLAADITSLSLTTLCGYLLDYPVLYCSHIEDGAAAAASSLHSNNLSMRALTRHVLSVPLRDEVVQTGGLKFMQTPQAKRVATNDAPSMTLSDAFICSFTVPAALMQDELISRTVADWLSSHVLPRTRLRSLSSTCCLTAHPHCRTESVTLPVVSL